MKGVNSGNPWVSRDSNSERQDHKLFVLWVFAVALCLSVSLLASSSAHAFEDVSKMSEAQKRERVIELYRKQIPLLEQHIQRAPSGPRAAESMFRLGEAYFETAKFYEMSGQSSRVSLYVKKATEILERLRAMHPTYERLDEALLVLASSYLENAQVDKAGPILATIADQFPNSPIMEEASYLLGDFYFDKGRLGQARQFYERAAQNERTQNYAHYRLAWVAQQEGRFGLALEHFEKVLKTKKEGGNFDYSQDAAREMVWPAIQVYGASKITGYLKQILTDRSKLKVALNSLANGLMVKEEYVLASKIFDSLITEFPGAPEQGDWLSAQLEAEEKLGNGGRILELVSRLNGSATNNQALQSKLFASAKKYHAFAQAEKDPKLKTQKYDTGVAYYSAFLQTNSSGPKAAEARFYLGEALYAQGQKKESAAQYKLSAFEPSDKQLDAAWNWYLVTEELASGFNYSGKVFRQPTADDEAFIEAARYVAQLEKLSLDRRRKASYQAARLVYQLNDFDRALPIFQALAERYPKSKEGKLSRDLVLDIYNLKKDYDNIALYARKFKSHVDSASRSDLAKLEEKAIFKGIQDDESRAKTLSGSNKASTIKRVASNYIQFARSYPQSSLVDSALWAAIQLQATAASFEYDKEFSDLRASFRLLSSRYKSSPFYKPAVELLGKFLADVQADERIVRAYGEYRETWYAQMRKLPAATSGPMGMLIYKLSDANQKRALEKRFLTWPLNEQNKEALAHGKISLIRDKHAKVRSMTIKSLKNLKRDTQRKLDSLAKLEGEVRDFLEMGVGRLTVEALEMLAVNFEDMASSIRSAPVPSKLEGENRQKYLAIIEQNAAEFDQKANETRRLARKAAAELNT